MPSSSRRLFENLSEHLEDLENDHFYLDMVELQGYTRFVRQGLETQAATIEYARHKLTAHLDYLHAKALIEDKYTYADRNGAVA